MADIKKVIRSIYHLDYSKCEVASGDEMITSEKGNEFTNTFILRDLDNGIIVTPKGYSRGLLYRSDGGGEIINPPDWNPDIVSFSFNIFGLKKGAFYRVTITAKNAKKYNKILDVTDDRSIEVLDENRAIIVKHDFSNDMDFIKVDGIFRANSVEGDIAFRLGKICIKDIVIEEVELAIELKKDDVEDIREFTLDMGKTNMCAFGCWSPIYADSIGRYSEVDRITGKGIVLYYDTTDNAYILERDNQEDTIGDAFTKANYIVDINMNKAPFADYEIVDLDMEPSPNTLKAGWIKFRILEDKKPVKYDNEKGRISISVYKIN